MIITLIITFILGFLIGLLIAFLRDSGYIKFEWTDKYYK